MADDPTANIVLAAVDEGHATDAVDRYTGDAVFETPAGCIAGRVAVASAFAVREADTARRTRHVLTGVEVSADGDASTLTGRSPCTWPTRNPLWPVARPLG
ncbi:nuclear transport factor 2 family protein [Streptomyces sp. NPDC047081]|uniref:nuclear transport factor 2 family protein n=1 Tax=Streptomyces sp. NPDC047081 TaxID=3154706 RepID=UPI0033F38292